MGIAITRIIPATPIALEKLEHRTLAVDGHNMLYQFLTTIRGPDGTPLSDRHGNVTSHLIGLFSRTSNLLAKHIRLIFVFDGKTPDLKRHELQRRHAAKADAQAKFEEARQSEDVDAMRKYAGRTAKLTPPMVDQAKALLDALGVPWIQAPGEGEAQAAALVKQGYAYAVVSQDADALLYGAPRIVKNLAITGRRKLPGKMAYVSVEPELIEHDKVLCELGLDLEQLRVLALLIGTDYNVGGIKGIGPKKGLKLVSAHDHDFGSVFKEACWDDHWDIPWQDILQVFEQMPTIDPGKIEFGPLRSDKVRELLIGQHDFSEDRVESTLERLEKSLNRQQKGLGDFF